MTHRTIPHIEVLGGYDWNEETLEALAAGSDEIPLSIDNEPAGMATNLRVAASGEKLYADFRQVPEHLAQKFPSLKRIETDVSPDQSHIGAVRLFTTPRKSRDRDTGSRSAEALKVYAYQPSRLGGTLVEHEDTVEYGAAVHRDGDAMSRGYVLAEYEGSVGEEVTRRVTKYISEHPETAVEVATSRVLSLDPVLRLAYLKMPWTIPAHGGAPMVDPISAGTFQQAQADVDRQARARMAKFNEDYETAMRQVLASDDELRKRYLGRI